MFCAFSDLCTLPVIWVHRQLIDRQSLAGTYIYFLPLLFIFLFDFIYSFDFIKGEIFGLFDRKILDFWVDGSVLAFLIYNCYKKYREGERGGEVVSGNRESPHFSYPPCQ